MTCGHRCYEIGGPWITVDPECPEHGDAAEAERDRTEAEPRYLVVHLVVVDEGSPLLEPEVSADVSGITVCRGLAEAVAAIGKSGGDGKDWALFEEIGGRMVRKAVAFSPDGTATIS